MTHSSARTYIMIKKFYQIIGPSNKFSNIEYFPFLDENWDLGWSRKTYYTLDKDINDTIACSNEKNVTKFQTKEMHSNAIYFTHKHKYFITINKNII